jgi:hypothetical protein
MDLIIKGMSLPRKSEHRECSIAVVQNRPVSIAFSRTKTNPFECFECAEIPTPHGRLIDADELLKAFKKACEQDGHWVNFFALVESAPTIIEAEVSE